MATPEGSARRIVREAAALCLLLLAGGFFPVQAQPPRVEVIITGLDEPLLSAVRSSLSLLREQGHALLTEYRIQALHRRAPSEIRQALEPFGFYRVRVEASLDREAGGWRARYRVEPGDPVTVRRVDLRITGPGRDDGPFRRWQRRFPLQPGDRLRHEAYEEAKDELLGLARRRGYFEARLVTHRIEVRVPEGRADIALQLATGPRYRFGAVRFSEVPLRESLLQRFLPFQPGDPYHADHLFALQRALADSDYFERVDVIPLRERAEERSVPIEVRLAMQERTRYTLGVGYGTDTGPRLRAGLERRWLNSRGHQAGAQVVASGIGSEVSLDYTVPLSRPTTDFLGFTADWTDESTETATRETALVGVALTRRRGGWQRTLALNYQEESFDVGGEEERSSMLVPGIGWQRIVADDRLFPRHGWRLAIAGRFASEQVLSATDLAQLTLRGKHITTAIGGRLISRFDIGASETSDFEQLPVSLRFFAGGDQSVRGYDYNALGPVNSDGEVVGGKHLLVASVEYERFWNERFGWAVFVDQGNAFNSTGDFDLSRGAGVGLRYKLPFGVIRADAAAAVSEPDTPWRLHITIGPEL